MGEALGTGGVEEGFERYTLPLASASGMRQFGYSLLVPGWFCARFSPTASVIEAASSLHGEPFSARYSASTISAS